MHFCFSICIIYKSLWSPYNNQWVFFRRSTFPNMSKVLSSIDQATNLTIPTSNMPQWMRWKHSKETHRILTTNYWRSGHFYSTWINSHHLPNFILSVRILSIVLLRMVRKLRLWMLLSLITRGWGWGYLFPILGGKTYWLFIWRIWGEKTRLNFRMFRIRLRGSWSGTNTFSRFVILI